MEGDYSVGDLVAEFLQRCGVDTVFGIVSIHNIPMLDAIGRSNAIRFVSARGETGAAHMADGYARAAGKLGVVFSSTGPGVANAVPGLVEARFACTPMIHLTGDAPSKHAGRSAGAVHQIPDQLGLLRSVSKAAFRVNTAQEAFGVLARAVAEALTAPCGPVSIEIPIDLQSAKIARPASLDLFELPTLADTMPSAQAFDELCMKVAAARRPMLWVGSGASQAGAAVSRLLDLGFGMVTSWRGRGVVSEDHPQNIGSFTGYGMPPIQDFYGTCDLMLVAGSRLRAHETGEFSIPLPRPLLVVDIDPAADGRTYPLDGFYRGHAIATLSALADRIDGRLAVDPGFQNDVTEVKSKMRAAYRETLGPYRDFPEILRKALPADAIWARDITIANSTWGNRLFQVHSPRDNIYPVSAGIGEGFPLGLGAAFAAPERKTAILCGDGGFQLSIAEFWTAVQEKMNIVLILMNDGGYGVIRQIQDVVAGGRHFYTDLIGPDIGKLAANAGVWHRRVESVDDLEEAVTSAVKVSGPAIVEVIVPSIGPIPPYYPFNNTAKE